MTKVASMNKSEADKFKKDESPWKLLHEYVRGNKGEGKHDLHAALQASATGLGPEKKSDAGMDERAKLNERQRNQKGIHNEEGAFGNPHGAPNSGTHSRKEHERVINDQKKIKPTLA